MKKTFAIALLFIQLFTICGHMVLYQYFVYKSDKLFSYQVSRNMYNVNDLVQIKVPVDMPHVKDWVRFEAISGQVQFKNACYNYVRLKLSRDTIYLMCVPNYQETQLITQNIINAKQIDDIPVTKKEHVPYGKSINLGNYNYRVILYKFWQPFNTLIHKNNIIVTHPLTCYMPVMEQPPKC